MTVHSAPILFSHFFCSTVSHPLFPCFQLLIQSEADLFVEDEEKLTPCDLAERHHHTELALSLESQMVFSPPSAQQSNADAHGETALLQYKEVRAQMQDWAVSCWLMVMFSRSQI